MVGSQISLPSLAVPNNAEFRGVTDYGLTASACVGTDASKQLVSNLNCGTGSGTLTGITAGNDIVVTGSAPTPTVAVTNSPTFTGIITATAVNPLRLGTAHVGTTGIISLANNNGTGAGFTDIYANNTVITSGVAAACLSFSLEGVAGNPMALDCSGDIGIAGFFASATLTSGRCLQATTNGQIANAASSCVTGVTAGNSSITVGGTATAPTISVTNPVTLNQSGVAKAGAHIETANSTSVAALSNGTFTFATAYAAAPVCNVATVTGTLSVTPAFNVVSVTTTVLTVENTNAGAQSYEAICIGL